MDTWGRVAGLMLRGVIGWRFAGAAVLLVAVMYILARRGIIEPSEAHILLGRIFAVFCLILASPLLPDERSRGTLEILWLACGSFRRLLRWKTGILVLGVGICAIPAIWVTAWYLQGRLFVWRELIFILTQSLLVTAWVFFIGSYLPQAWAGGVVASALLLALEWPLSTVGGVFNPFVQFYGPPGKESMSLGMFLLNRVVTFGFAWFFHDQASRRVRAWLA